MVIPNANEAQPPVLVTMRNPEPFLEASVGVAGVVSVASTPATISAGYQAAPLDPPMDVLESETLTEWVIQCKSLNAWIDDVIVKRFQGTPDHVDTVKLDHRARGVLIDMAKGWPEVEYRMIRRPVVTEVLMIHEAEPDAPTEATTEG